MLKLYELAPSPNNTKVRMALRFKGIDFEAIPVDPRDRSAVLDLSGQEATPVIADRGIVLNDSEAILQYLDANYRDKPRLFPPDKEGRRVCDAWREELDGRLAVYWAPVFFHALGLRSDPDPTARERFAEGLRWLEGELEGGGPVRGADKPVCDLRVAEWATYAFPGQGLLTRVPYWAKFQEAFGLDAADFPNLVRFLEPWNERLA